MFQVQTVSFREGIIDTFVSKEVWAKLNTPEKSAVELRGHREGCGYAAQGRLKTVGPGRLNLQTLEVNQVWQRHVKVIYQSGIEKNTG